jgi:hypothetical protein
MEHVNLIKKLLAHNPIASVHINSSHKKQTSDVEECGAQKQQTEGKALLLVNWFFMTPSIATKFQYINSL